MGLLALVACAPHTSDLELPVEPPPAFSAAGTVEAPSRWWTAFEDPTLERLMDRALASNLDLAAVWQRLREAQAVVDRAESDLFPDLDGDLEGRVERFPFETQTFDSSGEEELQDRTGRNEQLRLTFSATYEVDLWGRLRSRIEAERYRARASLADYHTAALSLSAEVARTWFQLVEAHQQVALLEAQVETNEKVLRLLENRFGSGQIRGVDVLRQRQLVESTREQRLSAEARLGVLEHLLAVLLGQPPQQGLDALADELPPLPPLPRAGIPMELVRRRPDVKSAFLRLRAADRDLAAAVANRYPRLTLDASLATEASSDSTPFEDWPRSLAAGLLAPLFRAGELAAQVDRTEAVRQRTLYEYGQATLLAFREVEDALVQEAKQRQRVESLERQVRLTTLAYEQLRLQFFNGLSDYIDVLTALTEAQRVRRDLTAARRELLEFRIALYRALAGGLETPRETEETVS